MLQKKNIIFFVLAIILIIAISIIIFEHFRSSTTRVPKITISEEEWDFGKVKPKENHVHKFIITNKGDKELVLERIRSSCGCVQTFISDTNILPGKSAELKAIFSTGGYEGRVEKLIYINSNDPTIPEKKIKVRIEVEHKFKPKINVSVPEWNIGLISQGDIVNLSVTIENQGDAELIIDKIDTYKHIHYNTNLPLKILSKEKFELILTYNSAEHKLGEVREAVRIYCNDPITESFFIRIPGYIKEKGIPEVSILPTKVIFDLSTDSENGAIEKFYLKNSGDGNIKIISVKSSVDYFTPLRSELNLKSQEEQDLQVVLLKDKAREEIEGDRAEEYLYLTVALPVEINK